MINEKFSETLTSVINRLGISEKQASNYFGVPVYTLRKWTSGQRKPSAAVVRLVEVLGLIEAMAPSLHDVLLNCSDKPE